MIKAQKVEVIEHLVTPEGKITLNQEEVEQIRQILAKRVKKASEQTENGYFYLYHQFRKLGQDLASAAHAADNISSTFSSLHNVTYDLQKESKDALPEDY